MNVEICTRCKGTGKTLLGDICVYCDGRGAHYDLLIHADDDCEDDLEDICPYCLGTGMTGDGLEHCDYCQGDGYL